MFEQVVPMTAEQFDRYAVESDAKILEFIGGEVYAPLPNNPVSAIAVKVGAQIGMNLLNNDIASLTGAGGGYNVGNERYMPKAGVLLRAHQVELDDSMYCSCPPDIAVEVEHPVTTESAERLTLKIGNYLAAGTTVWVVYPERKSAVVYAPGRAPRILTAADALDGGDILPGLSIPLSAIFKG